MAEAELTTVARPYARAAFAFALGQEGGLAAWSRMLALLGAAAAAPVVRQALDNPNLTTEQEVGLLAGLMEADLSTEGRNFVAVLAENGRLSLLPNIAELYEDLKAQHEKSADVDLTSAYEVGDEDQVKLAAALKHYLQKDIRLTAHVDTSLIGGVIVRTDDTVIDNSVRGKLEKLSQQLA